MVSMNGPNQARILDRVLAPLACNGKVDVARMPQYVNAEGMLERLRAALDPGR